MSATLPLVALDSTGHAGGRRQVSMIRRYIIWRSNHAYGERLRRIVRADVALTRHQVACDTPT